MLGRRLMASAAVLRPAASTGGAARATRSLSIASAVTPMRIANSANTLCKQHSLRWFSQSMQARNSAEAVAAEAQEHESPQESKEVNPNDPDFVLPEGASLRRTSKGELKVRPPKDETFASLKGSIDYSLWKALTVAPFGYTNMSDVQRAVLHLLPDLAASIGAGAAPMPDGKGRDMLVKARTGTGKTIAFLVPALQARFKSLEDVRRGIFTKPWKDMLERHRAGFDFAELDKHGRDNLVKQFANNTVGVLILSPTRELATQIADEARKLLTHENTFRVQLLVGGASRSRQVDDWRKTRPDVVVATPGRLLDLLNDVGMVREAMTACRTLILDEADTLLEMGFRDDLQAIMSHLPAKQDRQNMLFSATVSQEIQAIARASLSNDHRFVDCVPAGEDNVHKHIPQYATVLDSAEEQLPHVLRLIAHDQLVNVGTSKVIIFTPTTKMTQMVADIVRDTRRHLPAGRGSEIYEIHSKKDQTARFNTSDRFRKDKSGASVLITSDVSARGVDYPGTTRVIQIGVPSSKDQYIHRIGRTGRAGKKGRSDIVLSNWERGFLHFQLDDLPVKELSSDSLTAEVQALCERFDEAPEEFALPPEVVAAATLENAKNRKQHRGGPRQPAPARLQGPLTDKYLSETHVPLVLEAVRKMDEQTVSECFTSLLGFYVARGSELRTTKSAILEGLQKWATQAAGLAHAPYVSDMFLKKLGFTNNPGRGDKRGGQRGGFGNRRGSSSGGDGNGFRGAREGSGFTPYGSGDRGRGRFARDGEAGGGERQSFGGSREGRGSFSGGERQSFGGSREGRGSFDRSARNDGNSRFGRGSRSESSVRGGDSSGNWS